MSKRFTETEKWKDDWFLSLPNDYKIIWQYLNDNCSIAGFFKKNLRMLNYSCGTSNNTELAMLEIFGNKIIDLGDSFFIPSFLETQYPKGLTSDKPMIVSVRSEIETSNHLTMIKESLPNHYPIIKVRVRERERVMEKVKDDMEVRVMEVKGNRNYAPKKIFFENDAPNPNNPDIPNYDPPELWIKSTPEGRQFQDDWYNTAISELEMAKKYPEKYNLSHDGTKATFKG